MFVGTTKISNLDENVGATFVKLSLEEVKEVAAAVPEQEVSGRGQVDQYFKHARTQASTPAF